GLTLSLRGSARTPATHSPSLHDALPICLQQDLIVPVLLGAAETNNGVTRLLKALRHETASHEKAAERLGVANFADEGFAATVFKDRKSTRLNSSHVKTSYAVCCLKKKKR